MSDFFEETYPDSRTLVVAFTGYGDDGAPPVNFEWWQALHEFRVNRLFLMDCRQHWYQSGVKGFAESAEAIAERSRRIQDTTK